MADARYFYFNAFSRSKEAVSQRVKQFFASVLVTD
jgi:hypothetical protein